jgi:hypothetical protein
VTGGLFAKEPPFPPALTIRREIAVNGGLGQQSKPEIFDAAPIVRQIVESIQPVETIDHQVSYTCEGRKTNIHREAAATAFFQT